MPEESLRALAERIGGARRAAKESKDYELMRVLVETMKLRLGFSITDEAFQLKALVEYDEALAAFDRAMSTSSPALRRIGLEIGRRHAEKSAEYAYLGKDVVGALYAHMIIAGHFLPNLGKENEAYELLCELVDEATQLLAETPGVDRRIQRLLMNCRAHMITLVLDFEQREREFDGLVAEFKVDLESLGLEDEDWAKTLIGRAEDHLRRRR